jgi:hypothetical protein
MLPFDGTSTSFFLKVKYDACSRCTPDLKVERPEFAGTEVDYLCFSDCEVFESLERRVS